MARPEPLELRMLSIADGAPSQDFPGKQRFAPERHEALCIEILGVQRPQSHDELFTSGSRILFARSTRLRQHSKPAA